MLPPIVWAIAALLFCIGTVKVLLGLMILSLDAVPASQRPSWAHELHPDPTVAGALIDFLIVGVGLYTLGHAFVMLKLAPRGITRVYENPWTHIWLNGAVGLFSILFYLLVVYTNVHIHKDPARLHAYQAFGIGGGVALLAAASLAFVIHNVVDLGEPFFLPKNVPAMVLFVVLMIAFVVLCFYNPGNKSKMRDITTMAAANSVALMVG